MLAMQGGCQGEHTVEVARLAGKMLGHCSLYKEVD